LQRLTGKCRTSSYLRLEENNKGESNEFKEELNYTRMILYGYLSILFLAIQLLIYINRSGSKTKATSLGQAYARTHSLL